MAANSSIILSNLDFDTIKNTFKAYMKSQDRFKDYDFEGSNMNVLMDLLAYNTFHNSFYLNMIGNEMFLDSAQMRDSVVSHAKELNYTPRSFKSAEALVSIVVTSTDTSKRSIVIPKGTTFKSRFGTKNYIFSTQENIVIDKFQINPSNIVFTGSGITLYEGYYVSDTYTYNYNTPQRFVLTNKNVDISSLTVTVVEDVGATTTTYQRAQSLFGLNESSNVFFVQGAENESYEIVFGDNVIGRRPKDNSIIIVEYRISNGELPNGCSEFAATSLLDGENNVVVLTESKASGGSVSESIESIKFNAPRYFTTQERAITTEDYENLLKIAFPEINAVTAYGGEDLDPPQFGRVVISVDLKEIDGLPYSKQQEYSKFIRVRSPVSIEPIFADPEYTYINIVSTVRYNVNTTQLTAADIKTIVSSAIANYAAVNLNNFNRVFRYSKVVQAIDNSQLSVISNETNVNLIKRFVPSSVTNGQFDIDFKTSLDTAPPTSQGGVTIKSSQFTYNGIRASLKDNGSGIVQVMSTADGKIIDNVGTVDYDTGRIQFSKFVVNGYVGDAIKIYALPRNKDVATVNNVILNILEEDIDLTIVPVRA